MRSLGIGSMHVCPRPCLDTPAMGGARSRLKCHASRVPGVVEWPCPLRAGYGSSLTYRSSGKPPAEDIIAKIQRARETLRQSNSQTDH